MSVLARVDNFRTKDVARADSSETMNANHPDDAFSAKRRQLNANQSASQSSNCSYRCVEIRTSSVVGPLGTKWPDNSMAAINSWGLLTILTGMILQVLVAHHPSNGKAIHNHRQICVICVCTFA